MIRFCKSIGTQKVKTFFIFREQSHWTKGLASFPGSRPASRCLQFGKARHFLMWVTSWTEQIMRTWATCKLQKTSPARTHWSTTIPSWKTAVHEGAFMSLFTRQSEYRVLPSQDSEDTQEQFSHAHLCSIKAFLPPFYPWRHSHEEMYQALSRFTILQATGSWAGAWERGYKWMVSVDNWMHWSILFGKSCWSAISLTNNFRTIHIIITCVHAHS